MQQATRGRASASWAAAADPASIGSAAVADRMEGPSATALEAAADRLGRTLPGPTLAAIVVGTRVERLGGSGPDDPEVRRELGEASRIGESGPIAGAAGGPLEGWWGRWWAIGEDRTALVASGTAWSSTADVLLESAGLDLVRRTLLADDGRHRDRVR
ncbi:MAG: hypothetical protein ACLGI3_14120, partial [Actinomycetes bacterium]